MVRSEFFTERFVSAWNGLPEDWTDFSCLAHFKNSMICLHILMFLTCLTTGSC